MHMAGMSNFFQSWSVICRSCPTVSAPSCEGTNVGQQGTGQPCAFILTLLANWTRREFFLSSWIDRARSTWTRASLALASSPKAAHAHTRAQTARTCIRPAQGPYQGGRSLESVQTARQRHSYCQSALLLVPLGQKTNTFSHHSNKHRNLGTIVWKLTGFV